MGIYHTIAQNALFWYIAMEAVQLKHVFVQKHKQMLGKKQGLF